MNRKWFSIIALIAVATFFLSLSSCGFNQHLASINIPFSGGTFGAVDPNLYFNFVAIGTYVHPPATKDITDQVTWVSDNPQVATVSSTGVVSPNIGCGLANIYATFYDSPNDVMSNEVPVTVDGPASSGCTPAGAQPILTVDFGGNGTGSVTGAISCSSPSSCSESVTAGSTLTLTASATGGSTFGGWSGCSQTSGTNGVICTVLGIQNDTTVTATFN